MAGRWLRNKVDGYIYEWNPILAENPRCEEVTEEQAYPERFVSAKIKARKPLVDIGDVDPGEPPKGNVDVNQEASRGLK